MKCQNCGIENAGRATFCPECGGRMAVAAAPAPQYVAPQPQPVQTQPQAPPQQQYAPQPYPQAPPQYNQGPPPQYGQPYQQPYRAPKVPTVKSIHLGEVLFLISSVLLIGIGFDNLSTITAFVRIQYVLLGIVAILGGLLIMAMVVMPELLKPMAQSMDMLVLVFSLVFLVWGLVAAFVNNVGFFGSFLFAAGLFGLAGSGLKMGILK